MTCDHVMHVIFIFHFLRFYSPPPLQQPEKSKLKKIKKTPGDIFILLMCTKTYDQMMYGS